MIGDKQEVLDHGFVRLVDHMGGDLNVVRAARVSYDAAWRAGGDEKSDTKLIRYLMKNRHTTPFEAVTFTFEVKAPLFVFRQWHRHRTWSYNEVSARYTELPKEVYIPKPEVIGTQSVKNKQGRDLQMGDTTSDLSESAELTRRRNQEIRMLQAAHLSAFDMYRALLQSGWPRELARSVLPVATYSHMFASVNMHNLFHFLKLRLHLHAQYEIREYAAALMTVAAPIAPVSFDAFVQLVLNAD